MIGGQIGSHYPAVVLQGKVAGCGARPNTIEHLGHGKQKLNGNKTRQQYQRNKHCQKKLLKHGSITPTSWPMARMNYGPVENNYNQPPGG